MRKQYIEPKIQLFAMDSAALMESSEEVFWGDAKEHTLDYDDVDWEEEQADEEYADLDY